LPTQEDLCGAIVVFVRYLPAAWMRLVETVRPTLLDLVFFMDDDVLDLHASTGMHWRYRLKLARLAALQSRWLRKQNAVFWVSTPYLQHKYTSWQARLVLPSPITAPVGLKKIFYHGSASHNADIAWLQPVIAEVMQRDDNLVFEIIGDKNINRLFKGIPRTSVIHPMKWNSYQAFAASQTYHIGLNPLQDVAFNRARSYTKFFDITRCKAVGIYSPGSACTDIIEDGKDGLVVSLEQNAWVDAILKLALNEGLRESLLLNAEAKMAGLSEVAKENYVNLYL
jgi:glycosyltransferase involved in cell wall biosynthesis